MHKVAQRKDRGVPTMACAETNIASDSAACPVERMRRTFRVELVDGFDAAIDRLAEATFAQKSFLRRQWFAAAAPDGGKTLLALAPDGSPRVAIPLAPAGPPIIGLGTVPGVYWPFRSALFALQTSRSELAAILAHPDSRAALGPIWRMGPVYADEPTSRAFVLAAKKAGWDVLTRNLGTSFVLDLTQGDWPRSSTRKRLRRYRRKLEQRGGVRIETVRGGGWSTAVFDALEQIERASWVGTATDLSDAKFANPHNRAMWQAIVEDPPLAEALSATLLWLDERPVAFSFDLRAGPRQYAIASSYDEQFAECRVGQIVSYAQLIEARDGGCEAVDFGAGDGGYKREIGAEPASDIHDYLFVRSKPAAALLRMKWETGPETACCGSAATEVWDEDLIRAAAKGDKQARSMINRERILLAAVAAVSIAAIN